MAGMFDDLIAQYGSGPAAPPPAAAAPPGMFDDLIAQTQNGGARPITIRPQDAATPDASFDPEGTGSANYDTTPDPRTAGQRAQFAARATIDGIPFSDRAIAGVQSLTGNGTYSDDLAAQRAGAAARQQQDPAAESVFSTIGASALPVPAVGPVAAGAGLAARVGRAALAGGAIGGVQAASSLPDLSAPGGVADVGKGAAIGGVVGGVLPLAAGGVGALYRRAAGDIVPAVQGMGAPARNMLLDAIGKEGPDAVMTRQQAYGDPAMMFDYGTGLRGVAQGLATKNGPGAATVVNALGTRQAATNARVRQGLVDNFGPAQDPQIFAQGLADERARIGGMLPRVFAAAPPVDLSAAIDHIDNGLKNAVGAERNALLQARELLTKPNPPAAPAPVDTTIPDPTAGLGAPPAPGSIKPTFAQPSAPSSMFGTPQKPTGPAPQSLMSFLRKNGGVQDPGGDLKTAFGSYPGLIRPGGMPLDQARRAAAEAGYLGADTDRAMRETGINDLIDTLHDHPTFSVHDQDAVASRQAYAGARNAQPAVDPVQAATAAVKAHLVDSGIPENMIDPTLLDNAGYLASTGKVPVEQAWEAAVMAPPFPGDTPMAPRPALPPQPDRVPITSAAQADKARQELDDLIKYNDKNPLAPASSAIRNQQGAVQQVRGAVSDALKEQAPGYGLVMDSLANRHQQREAVNFGREALQGGQNPIWPSSFANQFAAQAEQPRVQDATRLGQRSLMEEAIGTKPNDQLAIKGLFQTGNTPGFAAPGVTPGNPDLSGWNAQKLATAFGHAPVANMQELLNANDAFNDTFNKVTQNAETARRLHAVQALEDPKWEPWVPFKKSATETTAVGLALEGPRQIANLTARALQKPFSSAARDAELATAGTATGDRRRQIMAELLSALPAREQNRALEAAGQKATLYGGVVGANALAEALRNGQPDRERRPAGR